MLLQRGFTDSEVIKNCACQVSKMSQTYPQFNALLTSSSGTVGNDTVMIYFRCY